ncbi:MAG: hypothetical protein MJ062_07300 [Oscillospiraceae bacterium]|nr:hypothetical protein [Oscillospiraceae bacterium]
MSAQGKSKIRISAVSMLHYGKLVSRSILLLAMLCVYLYNRILHTGRILGGFDENPILLSVLWIAFTVEIILRMFPSKLESMGCQKQFARNYRPRRTKPSRQPLPPHTAKGTFLSAAAWIALNGCIGLLYFTGIIDKGILLIICVAYSVCDMICILFFCPFQTWFLKNKCCTTCRIYNWDYAMMFTPLVFIPSLYSYSILALALILLVYWEIQVHLHPERFSEEQNESLSCQNCTEKLCQHKHQLQTLQKKLFAEMKTKTESKHSDAET